MTGLDLIAKWPELRQLSEKQILDGTARCSGEERDALLKFLLYLSEVQRRHLYEVGNKRSLWEFLEESLGFTVCETRLRYHSAKLLLRFPIVAEYLADGRLSMTTLVVMKDHLTPENVQEECDKASRKSKAAVELQVAEKNPTILDFGTLSAERAPTVTEVSPAPSEASAPIPDRASATSVPSAPGKTFVVRNAPSKASVKALTATQSVLTVSLHDDECAELEELRDLLSEIFPDRDLRKVVLHAIRELRDRILKKRGKLPMKSRGPKNQDPAEAALSSPPSSAPESTASAAKLYALKHVVIPEDAAIAGRNRDRVFTRTSIPALTARLVWIRDNHRCQRRLKGGGICGSTYRCQIDHIRPVADGGSNDPSNLQVHCRQHNLQRARERFGNAKIELAIAKRRNTRRALAPSNSAPPRVPVR